MWRGAQRVWFSQGLVLCHLMLCTSTWLKDPDESPEGRTLLSKLCLQCTFTTCSWTSEKQKDFPWQVVPYLDAVSHTGLVGFIHMVSRPPDNLTEKYKEPTGTARVSAFKKAKPAIPDICCLALSALPDTSTISDEGATEKANRPRSQQQPV